MKTKSGQYTIDIGSRNIPFSLHREERKHLRIVVLPDLRVDIFAPRSATEEHILEGIKKKAHWITKTFEKIESYHPLPSPRRFLSGETLVYLGRQYRLKVESGSRQPAKLLGPFLRIWVEDKSDTLGIKKSVETWYRKRADDILKRYMEKCYQIASRHGTPQPQMTIRSMCRRWGSCGPKGRISLNLNLVKVPVHCIEYVIMHELCHLKQHDHSRAFYSLLTRCLPDWRKRKDALDKFRLT